MIKLLPHALLVLVWTCGIQKKFCCAICESISEYILILCSWSRSIKMRWLSCVPFRTVLVRRPQGLHRLTQVPCLCHDRPVLKHLCPQLPQRGHGIPVWLETLALPVVWQTEIPVAETSHLHHNTHSLHHHQLQLSCHSLLTTQKQLSHLHSLTEHTCHCHQMT